MIKFYRTHLCQWKYKQTAIVAILHTLLALIATYPLITTISMSVVGTGDSAQNMWNLWWVRWAVLRGDWFPYFTNMLYYPTGVSLAYHPVDLLNGWIGVILQDGLGMNLVTTYNILVLGTFVATGMTAFYLVNFLTQNASASFVASIIFTYAPIRISRVAFGNLEMFSTEFIPLSAYFTIRLLQTHQRRYAVYAALTIAATTFLSLYLALGTAILIILLSVMFLIENKNLIGLRLKRLGLMGIVTLVLLVPVIVPMIQSFQSFEDQSDQLVASVHNSADLLGFFVPDNLTDPNIKRLFPNLGSLIRRTYATFYGNASEKTVFVGYTVIGIVAFAGIAARSKNFWKWLILGGIFFVLCLGPQFHVAGRVILDHMPYELLSKIPLIGFGRVPSRLAIFLMLALAVTSGLGLQALEARFKGFKGGSALLGLVIFLEFLAIPMPLDTRFAEISPYYWKLRAQPGEHKGVLDIPIDLRGAQGPAGNYMLYQTVHQKPITSGYISRTPSEALQLFERPFMNELRARIYGDTAPYTLDALVLSQAARDLSELDIGFVVLHRDEVSPEDYQILYSALVSVLAQPTYLDDQVSVWELDR